MKRFLQGVEAPKHDPFEHLPALSSEEDPLCPFPPALKINFFPFLCFAANYLNFIYDFLPTVNLNFEINIHIYM